MKSEMSDEKQETAAWKAERERAKVMRREKRGNAAKIREAYEFAEEFLRDYGTDWKLHNKMCDMLKSALAAPLRNCDIYDAESCRMAYHINGDGLMTMQAFADWLFAPAEEGAAS